VSLLFPTVVAAVVLPGAAPGADQGAVDQGDVAALSGDLLERAIQALGPRGEQFDHLHLPAAHRGRGDVVAARHVGKSLVMAQDGEDDRGDFPGGSLRHLELIFFKCPRSRSPRKVGVAVDRVRLDWWTTVSLPLAELVLFRIRHQLPAGARTLRPGRRSSRPLAFTVRW
jgi:hypothetical protein